MEILGLRNIVKRFGEVIAVDGVSISVLKGQTISLLGPSGCGKTTTLRIIAGFEKPDAGEVIIAGEDVRNRRPYERNVGLLFQDYALFPHMTVFQNIAYGPRYRGLPKADIPGRVEEMIALVRLTGLEHRRPAELSGGQRQRVALARALATNPQLVLLDEPLSALDAKLRQELRVELREILMTVGATTIVVTHDQEEAMSFAEHVVVMNGGKVEQQGAPAEIYARPANKFVAEFVGRSNWFKGVLAEAAVDGTVAFRMANGVTVRASTPATPPNSAVELCLRPERIHLSPRSSSSGGAAGDGNAIEGAIVSGVLLGAMVHYIAELADGSRVIVIDKNVGGAPWPAGTPVVLRFRPEDCLLVPAAEKEGT